MTANLQLSSEVTTDGQLRLSFVRTDISPPGPGQLLVAMQAAPVNPSDVGLLLARADPDTLTAEGEGFDRVVTATIPAEALPALSARQGRSLPVGNEGAGQVVEAGPGAQGLVGRTVALFGGSTYARYRVVDAAGCLPLPKGATAASGASAFVNPLTALGMVGTLRREDHRPRAHRRRFEPRPDARQGLLGRPDPARQRGPPARAGGAVAGDRGGVRL